GKVIDDGTISRLDEGTYRLTSAESSWRWLRMNAVGMDVRIEDISESMGALSLQGPLSRAILTRVSPADFTALKYFRLVHTKVTHLPVTISRTGYTGDLGYEIWVEAARALELWDALIAVGPTTASCRPACGRSTSRASRPASSCSRSTITRHTMR